MTPEERENLRYGKGNAKNPISLEENIMFSLLPACPETAPLRLLDVGCGIGTISLELQQKGFSVTGIDFSSVAIDKCKELGLDAHRSDVDQDGLRFPDKSFDVVWAGDVVEHVFDPLYLLSEIERVLKPGGILLVTVPNDFNLRSRLRIFITGKSVQSNIYRHLRQCKHHTCFSGELLSFMLADAGLAIDTRRSIFHIPFFNQQICVSNASLGTLFGREFIVRAKKLHNPK